MLWELPRIGKNENMLSSRPSHSINHWFEEMVIIIPRIIKEMSIIRVGSHIKTRNESNVSKEG